MKVIFLDVDGVLNNWGTYARSPSGCVGVSSSLTSRLRKIVKETDAKIILTSTWKSEWNKSYELCHEDGKYLVRKLHHKGLDILDKTTDPDGSYMRGRGVLSYLNANQVDSFVILDDELFDFDECELMDKCVITDYTVGLTNEDVERAIKILNGE